jgi:hypothetical protein
MAWLGCSSGRDRGGRGLSWPGLGADGWLDSSWADSSPTQLNHQLGSPAVWVCGAQGGQFLGPRMGAFAALRVLCAGLEMLHWHRQSCRSLAERIKASRAATLRATNGSKEPIGRHARGHYNSQNCDQPQINCTLVGPGERPATSISAARFVTKQKSTALLLASHSLQRSQTARTGRSSRLQPYLQNSWIDTIFIFP